MVNLLGIRLSRPVLVTVPRKKSDAANTFPFNETDQVFDVATLLSLCIALGSVALAGLALREVRLQRAAASLLFVQTACAETLRRIRFEQDEQKQEYDLCEMLNALEILSALYLDDDYNIRTRKMVASYLNDIIDFFENDLRLKAIAKRAKIRPETFENMGIFRNRTRGTPLKFR